MRTRRGGVCHGYKFRMAPRKNLESLEGHYTGKETSTDEPGDKKTPGHGGLW